MKKIIISLLITVLLAGAASAQTADNRRFNLDTATVDGTLKLEGGFIALQSGESVYYVPFLTRYINFIDELKEGASVSVEGYVFRNFIHPVKVTVADKSYDFIPGTPRAAAGESERARFYPFFGTMFGFRNVNPQVRNDFNQGRTFNPRQNNFARERSKNSWYNNQRRNYPQRPATPQRPVPNRRPSGRG